VSSLAAVWNCGLVVAFVVPATNQTTVMQARMMHSERGGGIDGLMMMRRDWVGLMTMGRVVSEPAACLCVFRERERGERERDNSLSKAGCMQIERKNSAQQSTAQHGTDSG
jgi:hypothetical protein